jgi:pimeloyl-ACP methyl ester carboxylesterase
MALTYIFFNIQIRAIVSNLSSWRERIGQQRDWVWRGWQVRYSYYHPPRSPDRVPLILLHGFGASIEHWRNNIPVLGQDRPVYALDLLGFGASRKSKTRYSVALWVEQVYEFWQTFIQQPVVLVGNSVGSLVCLVAAAMYPDMVQGIALSSLPDVTLRQASIPKLLQPVVSGIEGFFGSPVLLTPLFKFLRRPGTIRRWAKLAYEDEKAVNEELVDILSRPAYDEGASGTFSALFHAIRQPDFAPSVMDLLPNLDVPILLLWGRQDRMVPFVLAQRFLTLNPRLQFVELDPAGHCPHDECPDRFNEILAAWLTQTLYRKNESPACVTEKNSAN